jgi:alkyl sulfatase BDS1-like metallo-beta-lactamase superfamily hydrolase
MIRVFSPLLLASAFCFAGCVAASISDNGVAVANGPATETASPDDTTMSLRQPSTQTEATKIVDNIYMATGFGNTFLVNTDEGNVIIDTSLAENAPAHKALLDSIDDRSPDYIIITHAHGDHIGGVSEWRGENTQVVQQAHAEEFLHYQDRLKGFFQRRNAAQFGFELSEIDQVAATSGNYGADIPADILFDASHILSVGGLTFEIIATPSETYDALSVWIPERKAVFVGDLYYESFPNIYTLRGTKPRWALDYVEAIDTVLALEPEVLIPSHGNPIHGAVNIRNALEPYRDAILYVHDEVVDGMNAGKSVEQLVADITLPEALTIREIYGRVDWSVRGIHQGYAGWFDGDASSMLGVKAQQGHTELLELAGGPDTVADRAQTVLNTGQENEALAMADIVLSLHPDHIAALRIRQRVLQNRLETSNNFNSRGWLQAAIRETERRLKQD